MSVFASLPTEYWLAIIAAGGLVSGLWGHLLVRSRTYSVFQWRVWFWVSLGLTWTPFALIVLLIDTEKPGDRVVFFLIVVLPAAVGIATTFALLRWRYYETRFGRRPPSLFKWIYTNECDSEA